jgi:regulatory protein
LSEARKPPRKVTTAYLERAAKAYLERFASSSENLRRVLARKVERRCRERGEEAAPCLALIPEVIERCLRSGLVDDSRYAQARVANLRRRGGSSRMIRAKLAAKGVGREVLDEAVVASVEDELFAAHALARRRRFGPYRAGERRAFRDKDLAALARAGFPFDLARSVIDGEPLE